MEASAFLADLMEPRARACWVRSDMVMRIYGSAWCSQALVSNPSGVNPEIYIPEGTGILTFLTMGNFIPASPPFFGLGVTGAILDWFWAGLNAGVTVG